MTMMHSLGLENRKVVVIGSAPLSANPAVAGDEVIIAVNGGISSYPHCDIWVVNARGTMQEWGPQMRALSLRMLAQGADRAIQVALLLTKGDNALELTLARLKKQRTRCTLGYREIPNDMRRSIEAQAGGRDLTMAKHALSAGLFAVCYAFWAGAARVRMVGFSWEPGYAYAPDTQIKVRGHSAGDKQALVRLQQKYGERLVTSLLKESPMASKNARKRTSGGAATKPRRATSQLTPAAERARKTEQRKVATAAAVPKKADPLTVRATELTYYNNKRRKPGETFQLRQATDFRESCMERVDPNAPEPESTPTQAALPPASPTSAARQGREDNPLGV